MKYLITGATGFVGQHLAATLIEEGHTVYALTRRTTGLELLTAKGLVPVLGDLSNPNQKYDLPQVDAVIHCAGLIKALRPEEFYTTNTEGTVRFFEAVKDQPSIKNFVFVSSIAARGPNTTFGSEESLGPVSHYGKSKREAEKFLLRQATSFPVIVIRPPIVYGPGDRESFEIFKFFKKGYFPVTLRGQSRVSLVYVKDLVRTLILSSQKNFEANKILYPAEGDVGSSWNELIDVGEKILNKKIARPQIPLFVAKILSVLSEWAGRLSKTTPLFSRDKFHEMKAPLWYCSGKECIDILGFEKFTPLEDGFKEAYEWYRQQGWLS